MYQDDPFKNVPADLGPTLTKRGFESLTSCQQAVLAADLRGRDIRISSQTGSGKTVAIGLVLAEDMAAAEPTKPSGNTARPQFLLIAPTRELAAQLGQELTWLYATLRKRITVVTGGTNIGLDLRAFRRFPDIVIGTPGRLFDHVKRGTIDLSSVRAVVLDEADEMLDMGFRDELEGILKTTPEERRTHMVSATFAREVLNLAGRYQKCAVLVEGENPKQANTDITHIAHELRMSDRVNGLINILLAEPGQRTLVFVRTRLATTDVATQLTAAGFKAFPLSGDMGQRERTATLDAFRQGQVQLLIATDVAARGLDIQAVTRIVHFDLPENPEAFTHRSGRTGRAGAKGTSILFVPPSGRRKADFLGRATKIKIQARPVPTASEIRDAAEVRFQESFDGLEELAKDANERTLKLAESLLEGRSAQDVVAELLGRINITGTCDPKNIQAPRQGGANRFGRNASGRDNDSRARNSGGPNRGNSNRGDHRGSNDYTAFQVTWGAQQGADPRRMLALVCRRGDVRSNSIGAIRINDHGSIVEVRKEDAQSFETSASRPDSRDPRIKIRPWLETSERGKQFPRKPGFPGQSDKKSFHGQSGRKSSFRGHSEKKSNFRGKRHSARS
ncbi:MAG: DEAD/DEAH box helicase [Myxococcales bacterium]|nr:DEAD/DEAH box helicase [Myxococcales bacterium]